MNHPMPPQPPLPRSPDVAPPEPAHLPAGMGALSDQIAAVELRLLAREARVRRRVGLLRQGARSALKPQRAVWPVATAALLGWKLLPPGLRLGLSPATVATLVSVGLPLWRRWSEWRGPQRAPQRASN